MIEPKDTGADANEFFYARTLLPTSHGDFDVRVYRTPDDKEHLAISVGNLEDAEALPVRVHSECFTGEVLESKKCDCKAQLDAALDYIQSEGRGLVIYLRQEGRGIGLGNKIRAYHLQEQGADTVDANRMLGFEDDLRDYTLAARILRGFHVKSIVLLTNNPDKIRGLEEAGINVVGRKAVLTGVNATNHEYLATKHRRMGHMYQTADLAAAED